MGRHRKKLIFLLGFMGCGKTTAGALLAKALGWPFIDLDATIEAGQGHTIRQIFEQAGEPFFRELEHAALSEASRKEPAVIALGGGTFVQRPNFDLIRDGGGVTVWLDCNLQELQQRCQTMANRPLFRDPEQFLQLYQQRLPFYRMADYRVAVDGLEPRQVVEQILRLRIF